jgi:hypothetical protein
MCSLWQSDFHDAVMVEALSRALQPRRGPRFVVLGRRIVERARGQTIGNAASNNVNISLHTHPARPVRSVRAASRCGEG